MPILRGRVSSVSFRDEHTGETLAHIAPEGPNPRRLSYAFLGTFAHGFVVGEIVHLTGDWEFHARHGKIFRVTKLERRPPTTREGEIIFLSGYIKGLSKKQAALLLDTFGGLQDLITVCRQQPQRLDEVLPKARKVRSRLRNAQWDRREMDVDAFVALQSAGLRNTQIQELVRFFGASALRTIAQNTPYDLCQVPKVGFASAEKVARFYAEAQGRQIDLYNEERLVYGILHVVGQLRQEGDVCFTEQRIVRHALRQLGFPEAQWDVARAKLREAIATALKRRLLIKEFERIYPRGFHKAETELAVHLSKLMVGGARPLFQSAKAIVKELSKTTLTEEQRQAVATIATAPVSLLLGGPGRGKTFTLSAFINLLEKNKRSYLILAPTGKAAKRAAEVTQRNCQTIHKACGLDREDDVHARRYGRTLGRRDRFNVDVIIVDESSMIGLVLAFELVRRIKPGRTALVFVGDPDQLAPVEPGQLLKDLIASGVIPTARLTQVMRQGKDSPIVAAADAINTGGLPTFAADGYAMRLFDPRGASGHPGLNDRDAAWTFEIHKTTRWLVQALTKYASDLGIDARRDIQVYAPQRTGPLGLHRLNETLQGVLNPATGASNQGMLKIDGGFAVRPGDKVMQTKNNYHLRLTTASAAARAAGRSGKASDERVAKEYVAVMNGQIGYVTRVDPFKLELEVKFDDFDVPVLYLRSDEWRQLAPAYAMSIHKAQGSETPYAFIILHPSMNRRLVSRSLLYTAVTRAKDGVALFCPMEALENAVANTDGAVRSSNLPRRLQQVAGAGPRRKLVMLPAPAPAA